MAAVGCFPKTTLENGRLASKLFLQSFQGIEKRLHLILPGDTGWGNGESRRNADPSRLLRDQF
jgi:hypothetical protein